MTLTTVGYGDITAVNITECVVACLRLRAMWSAHLQRDGYTTRRSFVRARDQLSSSCAAKHCILISSN